MSLSVTFAARAEGQQLLRNIEQFGLAGVDSVSDLTEVQAVFLHAARAERARSQQQRHDF
jgi:outer membrane protein TolC